MPNERGKRQGGERPVGDDQHSRASADEIFDWSDQRLVECAAHLSRADGVAPRVEIRLPGESQRPRRARGGARSATCARSARECVCGFKTKTVVSGRPTEYSTRTVPGPSAARTAETSRRRRRQPLGASELCGAEVASQGAIRWRPAPSPGSASAGSEPGPSCGCRSISRARDDASAYPARARLVFSAPGRDRTAPRRREFAWAPPAPQRARRSARARPASMIVECLGDSIRNWLEELASSRVGARIGR